ncbi:MAG: hypothetical protein HQL24_02230 [Candidatus Omnitrophica bacterium]|nr:hypothetical protein [Candidatus Omnitrophota bacterium]
MGSKKISKVNIEESQNVPNNIIKDPNVSIADTDVRKPSFSNGNLLPGQKHIIKSSFLKERENPKADKTEILKKLGIEEPESYQPLNLH